MKKHLIVLGIIILLIVVGLTGCLNSDNEHIRELKKFVGTWKHGTLQGARDLTFFSNGTGIFKIDFVEWEIENGKLILYLPYRDVTLEYDYEFLDDNQTLILTDETGHIDDYRKL